MEDTIAFEEIKALLRDSYELVYIHYDDSLNHNLDEIQKSIHAQDDIAIYEAIQDWIWDAQWYGVKYVLDELKDDIERKFHLDEREVKELLEEHFEELRITIEDRDESNPLRDLYHNTRDIIFFYDTGVEIDETVWDDEETFKEKLDMVKDVLNITTDKYDDPLTIMLIQASYGGTLVIYFKEEIPPLLQLEGKNLIKFKDPLVAVINTCNGSGDHTDLPDHEFSLPLNVENIFIDKLIKYSYVYEVCGLWEGFCECTEVSFDTVETPDTIQKSGIHAHLEMEALYNKAYKEGGCTFGDMDIKRHRDTYYLNEFPCGTHCPHCKTFWID